MVIQVLVITKTSKMENQENKITLNNKTKLKTNTRTQYKCFFYVKCFETSGGQL